MAFDYDGLIVFEMANNHQGSVEHGLRIIGEMAGIARRFSVRCGVKLQYRDLDSFIHPDFVARTDVKHIPRFLETRLEWEEFQDLILATRDAGMQSVVTPFDERSVEMALNHGVDVLKIASCSCMDWPLLGRLAETAKPLICSTGGCRLSDVDKIVTFFEHRGVSDLALLHCVGIYPTEDIQQQLGFMRRMMVRYPQCPVGYSGHEAPGNLGVARAVVAMGARILERHVGVPTASITLNRYSMNPGQTARWVEEVVKTRELCEMGDGDKHVPEDEADSLRSLARGVYARSHVAKGEKLKTSSVFFAMPCQPGQTTTTEFVEEAEASKDYSPLQPIEERRAADPIRVIRSVVHDAKGLLREAGIATGPKFEVELSHHFGMESFRRYGATIVTFVNREYCKKLIILLPGQTHPAHFHNKKEETFQVLYGEMKLVLDDRERSMNAGDLQLIRRGEVHSFATQIGVVFEEISTTHVKGDSVYEDAQINRMDPIERKSTIDNW